MEYRISIPRTPEVFLIEGRAFRRFRHRYFGWLGIIFFLISPPFWIVGFWLGTDLPVIREGLILLLFVSWLSCLYRYCNAGFFEGRGVLVCVSVLAARVGLGFLAPWPRTQKAESVVLDFTGDGINVQVNGGEGGPIPWGAFPALWQFPDCWILVVKGSPRFVPLPMPSLNEDCRDFIAAQVRHSGGAIQANPGLGLGLMFREKVI